MATRSIKHLLLLGALSLVFSSCGIFSNQYSYNSSRGGSGSSTTRPSEDRREANRNSREDEEFLFDEEEKEEKETVTKVEKVEKIPVEKPKEIELDDEAQLRREVAEYAHNYLGTKYKYGGKTPDGFDCSGFTKHVMDKFDVELPGVSAYQAKEGVKVKFKNARPGDLVFFRRSAVSEIFHVAMIVENDEEEGITVIHSASRGVVLENISRSSYWSPKMAFARNVLTN
jgi:cell wall-associated NlpC family hydrolase